MRNLARRRHELLFGVLLLPLLAIPARAEEASERVGPPSASTRLLGNPGTNCTCLVDGFPTVCPIIDTTGFPQFDCGTIGIGGGGEAGAAAAPTLTNYGPTSPRTGASLSSAGRAPAAGVPRSSDRSSPTRTFAVRRSSSTRAASIPPRRSTRASSSTAAR